MTRRIIIFISIATTLVLFCLVAYFWAQRVSAPAANGSDQPKQVTDDQPAPKTFDKSRYSLSDPASSWVVVNKLRPIAPTNYVPTDLMVPNVSQRVPGAEQMKLRTEASAALESMFTAATAAGFDLQITTAFRGYNYQKTLYDGYVASDGQATADNVSARPGYSEHQTGWAADIRAGDKPNQCYLEQCFGAMEEGKWLAAHAHEYGFLLRYPADKVAVTGYTYEPWHFRYIGTELATEMHDQSITTLEEFFGLSAATNYAS